MSVTDLRDRSGHSDRGRCLRLSIADLRDHSSRDLRLSVRDLSDWDGRGCLRLSIRDLGDGLRRLSLRLAIRDLAYCGSNGGASWLSVRRLGNFPRGGVSARKDVDQDGLTLSSPVAVVQVIEATAQALVEDSRGTESEGGVTADRETISVDGSGLGWSIKLELIVGRNVSGAALLVGELAIGESDNEGSLGSWAGTALCKLSQHGGGCGVA